MFYIDDIEFEIEEATFGGIFMDAAYSKRMGYGEKAQFRWCLDIRTKRGPFVTDLPEDRKEDSFYEQVSPRLSHLEGFKLPVKSWKDIEGIQLQWDSPLNSEGEEAGCLFVFGHEDVTTGRIEFLHRTQNGFFVKWTGTANIFWDEDFGADVPFSFEGEVVFTGIKAHCNTISALTELELAIQEFVTLDEYDCVTSLGQERGIDGTNRWKFVPKEGE